MATFFSAFFLFVVILVLVGAPVLIVAQRQDRTATVRNLLVVAGVLALVAALISLTSERLEAQCRAAGSPTCTDFGADGMQALIVAGFLATAWIRASVLRRKGPPTRTPTRRAGRDGYP